MKVYGQLVDIHNRDIYPAAVTVLRGKIKQVERIDTAPDI